MKRIAVSLCLAIAAPVGAQLPPVAPPVAAPADPARLAAAQTAVAALVPVGIYRRMMQEQLPRMMQGMMEGLATTRPSDLGLPPAKGGSDEPLGVTMAKQDPAYATKMADTVRLVGTEMAPLFDAMEPRMRDGLARAFARRFTLPQLAEMNGFFATPAGRAFANDYLLTFMDPEVMTEMMKAMPEMMKAMPSIMAKLDAQAPGRAKPPR